MPSSLYDFEVETLDGRTTTMAEHRGKVLLIVNTASACGYTPQFAGLEALYEKYRERGLVVLGFPCNQFGFQEPGDAAQIGAFCTKNYGVTFPMHAKVKVNGRGAHPLWKWLEKQQRGLLGSSRIKWNFTKFLVDREGRVVERYAPRVAPEELEADLVKLL